VGKQFLNEKTVHPVYLKALPPLHQRQISWWIKKVGAGARKTTRKLVEKEARQHVSFNV